MSGDRSVCPGRRNRSERQEASETAGGVAAEVKSRLNIVDVVGETVQLKKAGTTFKGLCPFHGEKTPSFTVTPSRDSWKCFGCGLGGDVFSFVMQRDGVTFPEALRTLAAKAGVEIDERTKREDAHRARLRDVLETAIAFYHQVLTATSHGQAGARLPARPRLHRRDDRDVPARLGARGLGHDEPASSSRSAASSPRSSSRRASPRRRARRRAASASSTSSAAASSSRSATRTARATGMGGRILGAEGRGRPRHRPEVPQHAGHAAVRQEPLAVPDRQGQGRDAQVRPGRDRRGLHGRADGPPGRASTTSSPRSARRSRRARSRSLTRYAKRIALAYDVDAAGQKAGTFGVQALQGADRPARGDRERHRARRGPRRPAAGRQGSRRGHARRRPIAGARRSAPRSRSSSTSSTPTPRPTTSRRPAARPASSTR